MKSADIRKVKTPTGPSGRWAEYRTGFWLREIALQLAVGNEQGNLEARFRAALYLMDRVSRKLRKLEIKHTKGQDAPASIVLEKFLDENWNRAEWGEREA